MLRRCKNRCGLKSMGIWIKNMRPILYIIVNSCGVHEFLSVHRPVRYTAGDPVAGRLVSRPAQIALSRRVQRGRDTRSKGRAPGVSRDRKSNYIITTDSCIFVDFVFFFSFFVTFIRPFSGHVRLRLSVTERGSGSAAIVQADRDEKFYTRQQPVAVLETARRHQSGTIDTITRVYRLPQKRR